MEVFSSRNCGATIYSWLAVADPGFPAGGRGPQMRALFGENVCENERIGSHRGWRAPGTPPPQIRQWLCSDNQNALL